MSLHKLLLTLIQNVSKHLGPRKLANKREIRRINHCTTLYNTKVAGIRKQTQVFAFKIPNTNYSNVFLHPPELPFCKLSNIPAIVFVQQLGYLSSYLQIVSRQLGVDQSSSKSNMFEVKSNTGNRILLLTLLHCTLQKQVFIYKHG